MKDYKNNSIDDNQLPKIRSGAASPRENTDYENAIPGINNPEIGLPAFNPPVPNRAWTAMRAGADLDELSEEEKRMLYYGRDDIM